MTEQERDAQIDKMTKRVMSQKKVARDLVEMLLAILGAASVNGCHEDTPAPVFIQTLRERITILERQIVQLGSLPLECICEPTGEPRSNPDCPYCKAWNAIAEEKAYEFEVLRERFAGDDSIAESDLAAKAFAPRED